MAEISLQTYIEYVEDRLARDAIQEVLSHCHHILEQYPKNLAIYRLFGKALLEQGDHHAASDIFQRVLSADPTDFWAHIGMSMAYQETGAFDQAIWHLERAYEQAPSNEELQAELKRLIKERDRVEPRKIQLTRGALARLYAKGRLYQQAIAEITEALREDPERLDLQVLLAQMLWDSRQEIKAGKVAAEILRKIPYCLQANRILADLWLHTGQAKEAQPFIERVKALDPYLGYELEHDGSPAPKESFRLTQFEWTPVAAATAADAADWVHDLAVIEKSDGVTGPLAKSTPQEEPAAPSPTPAESPDWLQQVMGTGGVLPTLETAETPPSPPSPPATPPIETPGKPPAPEGAPAWLQGILDESTPPPAPPTEAGAPAWLGEAEAPPAEAGAEGEPGWLDDVLSQTTGTEAPTPPASSSEELPDWLGAVLSDTGAGAAPIEESPEEAGWLEALAHGEETPTPIAQPAAPAGAGVLPDWLQETPPSDEESVREEGEALAAEMKPRAPQEEEQVTELTDKPTGDEKPEGEVPEWMTSGDLDSDEAMAWLEGLAARQGAREEEFVTSPEERERAGAAAPTSEEAGEPEPEPLPDWLLKEADAAEEAEDVIAKMFGGEKEAEEETAPPPLPAEETPTGEEILAAEEAPVAEEAPEAPLVEEAPPAPAAEEAPEAPVAEEAPPAPVAEEAPPAPVAEEAPPAPAAEEAPPAPVAEEAPPAPVAEGEIDEAMAWLEGLAARQGAREDAFVTSPEAREAAASERPEWLRTPTEELKPPAEEVAEEKLPEWLAEPEESAEEAPAPSAVEEDTMTWLDSLAAEQGVPEGAVAAEALEADKPEPPPPAPEGEEAVPAAAEELPDWLFADTEAREEMTKAVSEPMPSGEEVEEVEPLARAKEEDIAWLSETLGEEEPSEELSDLEALFRGTEPEALEEEKEPQPAGEAPEEEAEGIPSWLAEPEVPEKEEEEEKEEAGLPAWLREEAPREAETTMDTLGRFLKEVETPAAEAPAPPEPAAPPVAEAPAPPEPAAPPVAEAPAAEVPAAEVPPAPPPRPAPAAPPAAPAPSAPVTEAPPTKPTGLLPEYERKLTAEPEDYATRLALAREHLTLGNYDEALVAYDVLVSNGQMLGDCVADLQDIVAGKRVRDPRTFRLLGDALMAQGRLQEALNAYRGALDRF
jgi:tetratricopeptide (TPR) repeat protein